MYLNCGDQVYRLKQFVNSALRNLLPVEPEMGNSVMNSSGNLLPVYQPSLWRGSHWDIWVWVSLKVILKTRYPIPENI